MITQTKSANDMKDVINNACRKMLQELLDTNQYLTPNDVSRISWILYQDAYNPVKVIPVIEAFTSCDGTSNSVHKAQTALNSLWVSSPLIFNGESLDHTEERVHIAGMLQYYREYDNYIENYDIIKLLWKRYYDITLFDLGVKDQESIDNLFYNWVMDRWKFMWMENSEYKDFTKKELFNEFVTEAEYISDRISFDYVFKVQWLFLKVFKDEIYNDMRNGENT